MKLKIFSVLIALLLISLMAIPALAEESNTYELDELDMSISIPSNYVVFTRDIDADDPNLDLYGLTKDDMSSLMTSGNIYLNAWDQDVNDEIIVTMIESPLDDFNQLSDIALTTLASTFATEYENIGIKYIKAEIYQHEQAKFLKIYISQIIGDSTAYGLQYCTVYAGKAINITMHSYSGTMNSAKEGIIKEIVNSAMFSTAPNTMESNYAPTSAFQYTDPKTQTTFTVPANWVETALSKEREYIDTKFCSNEELGLSICYGSFDAYETVPEFKKLGVPRSQLNVDRINAEVSASELKEMFAEMYGGVLSDITLVKYGKNSFYLLQATETVTVYGTEFEPTLTLLLSADNGYFYTFMFFGTSDNAYYGDFEALLTSVEFSGNSNESGGAKNGMADLMSRFHPANILFGLLVTIAVYSLPIILYRYVIRRAPIDKNKARNITLIYGFFALVVMSILMVALNESGTGSGAILFWSYVNYRMLIGGKKPQIAAEKATAEERGSLVVEQQPYPKADASVSVRETISSQEQKGSERSEIKYCHKCGSRLLSDSKFCYRCGTKTP